MPWVELTMAERIDICRHSDRGRITNKALLIWTSERTGKEISEMTISRLLKRKTDLLGSDVLASRKRYRKPECPNLEAILNSWFLTMHEANVTISDAMLVEKARMLQISVPRESTKEFKFSNGWLQGFKSKHGITVHVRHGEGASAEITEDVLDRIEALKAIISGYDPEDVFNMDETSLFYQLELNRTLATRSISGKKKSKSRLTIALTANMTGTWKLPPFVVYKYVNPRAFSCRSIRRPDNLGILLSANSKAWMTIKLFEKFLLDFERRLKEAGRKSALLLLDNFTGHKIVSIREQIKIIKIEFLPPNVTSVYQPMDAGIIRAFKAHYRKYLIHLKLDRLQTGQTSEVDIYEAILMLEKAWRIDVTAKTVKKCWIHSKLVRADEILPDFKLILGASDRLIQSEITAFFSPE
ncbi:hypothetical protein R1sor_006486 [Riccia sorocarpa]|uniref:HTH CENPB-type domain-containing protein n=1 Tax=Riccia sorocarpa TaxID=122646 RepID=A0ABD3HMM3_9MARC